jgi:hypothetical protein
VRGVSVIERGLGFVGRRIKPAAQTSILPRRAAAKSATRTPITNGQKKAPYRANMEKFNLIRYRFTKQFIDDY